MHLDESCLGNGREGASPGGAAGIVEIRTTRAIERRDFSIHAPDTTNNRMALAGAIAVLQLLAAKQTRLRVLLVSDSEYLVRGIREWVPGWMSRGWKRKSGAIENLELWQALVASIQNHEAQWTWIRGHSGHPKNEYANDLAVSAAREQHTSRGVVPSEFAVWLAAHREKGQYLDYDPDAAFTALEARLATDTTIPIADVA